MVASYFKLYVDLLSEIVELMTCLITKNSDLNSDLQSDIVVACDLLHDQLTFGTLC